MNNDTKRNLTKLGFDIYPGCRLSAINYAIEELGIPLDEIIDKLSDDDALEAIDISCQNMGLYSDMDD